MKLGEAMRVLSAVDVSAPEYAFMLISAHTPEPLSKFLAAQLQNRLPGRRVVIKTGLFGDLEGNLARFLRGDSEPGVLLIEWADLDPRLGLRQTGGWGREIGGDIARTVEARLQQLVGHLERHPAGNRIVVVPPTLPFAPVLPVPTWQVSTLEAECEESMAHFVARSAALPRVCVLAAKCLGSSAVERLDLKSWWQAGSPYRLSFASELAGQIALAAAPAPRYKGIITDLDNTLWSGILGEVGVGGVHWDLDHHALAHGVYQQLLQSLADDGVLVAIASKNDKPLVEECLRRPDMLLNPASIFPIEAHWQLKAESAARILQIWNIAPDSVLFLDDNVLEVESMRAAFPTMDCRLFPVEDPDQLWQLFRNLTDLFGKAERREEDALRLESIRGSAARAGAGASAGPMAIDRSAQESVLEAGGGELMLAAVTAPPDPRALELINKTNQFNLNGERYTEAEWLHFLRSEGAIARIASYRDKFGHLGKIAVLAARREDRTLHVEAWVLSCRAFSRRIEHAMLEHLFDHEGIDRIVFRFRATERNTPLREFMEELTGNPPAGGISISRSDLDARKPALYLTVGTTS